MTKFKLYDKGFISIFILLSIIVCSSILVASVFSYSSIDNSWTLATNDIKQHNKLGYYAEFTIDILINIFGIVGKFIPFVILLFHIMLLFSPKFNWVIWFTSIIGLIILFLGLSIIVYSIKSDYNYFGVIMYEVIKSYVNSNIIYKLLIGILIFSVGMLLFFNNLIIVNFKIFINYLFSIDNKNKSFEKKVTSNSDELTNNSEFINIDKPYITNEEESFSSLRYQNHNVKNNS